MKRTFLFSVIAVMSLSMVRAQAEDSGFYKAPDAKAVFSLERFNRIDRLMKQAIEKEALPSAVCYVSYDGKPLYCKAFGLADRETEKSLKTNAIFRYASQTSLITVVALMKLYEEGLFRLDDPVKKFLPEFSNPRVYVSGSVDENNLQTRPAYGDITIRQLLGMTSGIGYEAYDQDVHPINYRESLTTGDAVRRIAKLPLKHDPGEGYTEGFGMDVAGRLAEVVSGIRLDSLIHEKVLKPLDMKDTYFYLPLNKVNRLVPLYQKFSTETAFVSATDSLSRFYPLARNQLYFGGGAGLCGTIEDFAKLCNMIINQGRIGNKTFLSRKTIDQMCVDQIFGIEGNFQFGLGFKINTDEDFARTMITPGSLSGGGDFGTGFLIDPRYRLVVLLNTNAVAPDSDDGIWGDLLRIIYMSLR